MSKTTIEISAHAAFAGPNGAYLFGTEGTLFVDFDAHALRLSTAKASAWPSPGPFLRTHYTGLRM